MLLPRVSLMIATLALSGCGFEGPPDDERPDPRADGDVLPPAVVITDDAFAVARGAVTFTFTFSEDVGDTFVQEDVTVAGGSVQSFASDGLEATLVVSPPAGRSGAMHVRVEAGAFEDAAGNANPVDATASRAYDLGDGGGSGVVLMDFDGDDPPVTIGFGALFPEVVWDPEDGANRVASLLKAATAEPWAGATLAYCPEDGIAILPMSEAYSRMSVRFWSPDADIPVRLKVENHDRPEVSVETEAITTRAGWQTLVFDFSEPAGSTTPLDPTAVYDKLSIFPNFGTEGRTAGEKTYYVDDIRFEELAIHTGCPLVAEPGNLLADAGGEGWVDQRPIDWLIFPEDAFNLGTVPATGTFTPYEGKQSPGMRGQNTGAENVTAIYQEFDAVAGERFTMSGYGLVYDEEPIGASDTTAYLTIKFFTSEFEYLGQQDSGSLTSRTTAGSWIALTTTGTAPPRTEIVQAAMEMRQCAGAKEGCATSGVVLFDAMRFVRE